MGVVVTVSANEMTEEPIFVQSTAFMPTTLLPSAGGLSSPCTPGTQDMLRVERGTKDARFLSKPFDSGPGRGMFLWGRFPGESP